MSDPFRAISGVAQMLVWRPASEIRIKIIAAAKEPTYTPEEETRWNEIRAANPRVHDGAILGVHSMDGASGVIVCRRERYKRLALQASAALPPSGVWMLGVKGWITVRDSAGGEHLLIARRGAQTRIYAGLWESAPAGGVDPPREGVTELDAVALAETLAIEAEEELGMDLDIRGTRVMGVCRDLIAGSDDIFVGVELAEPIDPLRTPRCQNGVCGWEYTDAAWLSRADAPGFDARPIPPLVPPTRAMLRMLGWA